MVRVSLLTLLGSVAALTFCLDFFPLLQVKGKSMSPALLDRQLVLLDRLAYRWHHPQYDDKIVFSHPQTGQFLVKRVVLLPGNRLQFLGRNLLLPKRMLPLTKEQKERLEQYSQVPEESYFVLGDNLEWSIDSRDFGFVKLSAIKGRVRP